MKIYSLGPLEQGDEYLPTKKAALARLKEYGEPDLCITEIEIGKLTKDVACRLASGRGFAKSMTTIYGGVEGPLAL
jgi:hypothetical protein